MTDAGASKYENFSRDLRNLCVAHGVQIGTSGYDSLVVYDLEPGDKPIYMDQIEDRTSSGDQDL